MQDSNLAGLSGRPQAHRAMSSSAAFSPYTSFNRRQHFEGQTAIGSTSSIAENGYSNAIGSARLNGQVVPPPNFGSAFADEHERSSREHSRDVGRGRLNRTQTLSGSTSFELPPPGEVSPAGNRIRSRFESFNAGSTSGNNPSPFAGNGLGFGGTLANSTGRGSFGVSGTTSATGATFGNTAYSSLGMGYPASARDRDGDRPYDGAPTGFSGGFLNVPLPGTSTRSNSFSGGEWRSPRGMMSVMPSLPSSTALDQYTDAPQQPVQIHRNGSYRGAGNPPQFAETFSDTSSPPSSPRMGSRALQTGNHRDPSGRDPRRPHSPPRATAFVSRSRSQSLAISGLRPTLGSGLIPMPMSTIPQTQDAGSNPPQKASEGGFANDTRNAPTSPWGAPTSPFGRDAFGATNDHAIPDYIAAPVSGPDAWGRQRQAERERDRDAHADLAHSIQAALGGLHDEHSRDQQPAPEANKGYNGYANGNGGDESNGHGGNGASIRSGASSRRHSVSVVGRPAARTRGFGLPGFGFSDVNNTNVVHRYGPVHQAERESIYPQPFGGSNGRFRAGDEPQVPTLGSRNLGGYTDEDLLAGGFSNQLNLRAEGEQAASGMANAGAVPIGRQPSSMVPSSTLDRYARESSLSRDYQNSLNQNFGTSAGGISGVAGREALRRTPSQASASPQYNSIDTYMSGSARAQTSAGAKGWPNAADRFKDSLSVGSPTSELSSSINSSHAQANNARGPNSGNLLAPGAPVPANAIGLTTAPGQRIQNGGFDTVHSQTAGSVTNGMQAVGPHFHTASYAGTMFVPQRAPMPNVGFHSVGSPAGNMGMGMHRVHPHGTFVAVNGFPMPNHGMGVPSAPVAYRQPQIASNGHAIGHAPARPTAPPTGNGVNLGNGNNGVANAPVPGNPADLFGRGVPLSNIEAGTRLYIVEFKAKRTDVFFANSPDQEFHEGDVVIVEADRGKDLGTVINDTVTLEEVREFAAARRQSTAQVPGRQPQVQASPQGGLLQSQLRGVDVGHADPAETAAVQGLNKEIMPKRIFRVATPADLQHMPAKRQDEDRALAVCRSKVLQHGLLMNVVAAEYQWDRRKLTFYFTAKRRVDFRDLVKELFRIHKTRIWMACLGGSYLLTDENDRSLEMPNYRTQPQ